MTTSRKKMDENPFNPWKNQQEKMMEAATDAMNKMKMASPLNPQQMLASQQRNLEALNEANKTAVEVMKSITQLQGQYMRQAFEDMNSFMRAAMTMQPDQAGMQYGAQKMQENIQKAVDHTTHISKMMAESGQNIGEKLQKRMEESMTEFKDSTKH